MTLLKPKQRRPSANAIADELGMEILKSDRLRITILVGVIGSALLVVLLLSIFSYEQFQRAFHGSFKSFLACVLLIIGLGITCLLLQRRALARKISQHEKAFALWQYLSAFVETSIPTAGMILSAQFLGPVYALFTPATFIYSLLIVLSVLRLNHRLCLFTGAVAGFEYSVLAMFFLRFADSHVEPMLWALPHHLLKGFLLFLSGVVAGLVSVQIKKRIVDSIATIEERNRISRTFGEYVSPAVMDKLLTLKPDLRSEKRNVCVMFLDIRNFTGFAEKRNPEQVVEYLESLFEFMIEIVNRHHGIVNKFLGDGFMAVFGAPISEGADCQHGLEAAREILGRVQQEVTQGNILPTRVGMSLHAGEAVTGSIGSSLRREYTVIGDVVNLAARIEQLNKEFGSQLLISEAVWESVPPESLAGALPMGHVPVRGRAETIKVYKVA